MHRSGPEPTRYARAGVAIGATLAVLLPALVCGAHLDAVVLPEEVERLRMALSDPQGSQHGPAALFYGTLLPADLGDDLARHVPRARIATMLAVLVLSTLLYLVTALARTRGTGVLACVTLALSPAVADPTLRPEVPSAVFGMLGVLVLAGMPAQLRAAHRGARTAVLVSLLAVSVALALGLAVAASSAYGVWLLVPGGCLLLAVALALVAFVGVVRRRGPTLAAFRGFTSRTAPWLVAALAPIAAAALLLSVQGLPETPATPRDGGLLSSIAVAAWTSVGLAVVGALAWCTRLGLTLGRRRRIDADTVLLVFVAALAIHRLGHDPGVDALPAAPAFAVPVAIGGRLALAALFARLR